MNRMPFRALSIAACLHAVCVSGMAAQPKSAPAGQPTVVEYGPLRIVDLNAGESAVIKLVDGTQISVKLLELAETRDPMRDAVRASSVRVEVNGRPVTVNAAIYNLPITFQGVRMDCPVTRGYTSNSTKDNTFGLFKDARLRFWPGNGPLLEPGTFIYPLRQRWFATLTQMANEPTYVDGGEVPGVKKIYYHYGMDFGGAEGLVEVIAATDGLVVSSAGNTLPEHKNSPAAPRYDVIYVVDGRGWYYRYSHLMTIDVKVGDRVRMGQRMGLLGKEGGSGGWSHLHFDITSRQPSGEWGIQDGYAYIWDAWQRENHPKLIAVARPHRFATPGDKVTLDASKSWSATGKITGYEWMFTDGGRAKGAVVDHKYTQPGTYSEIVKVTDSAGLVSYDFAIVQIVNADEPKRLPPTIHPAFYPTTNIRAGDEVTFKVRTFRTTHGEEEWDFGDGTPRVKVKSDGNVAIHAKDGYAITSHRFAKPGQYIVRVERTNDVGYRAVGHLFVEIQ